MKKNNVLRVVLIILIGFTVLFIWGNSVLGRDASTQQSDDVRSFLQNAVDLLGLPWQVTAQVVRKTAHFLLFFLLGTEITLYRLCGRKLDRRDISSILCCVFSVAFLDETIQIFSKRGPAITDVWLDVSGGVTAMLLVFALYYLIAACRRKRGRG